MHSVQAIVLAAGQSRRFSGPTSKLLAPVCGQPLVLYPLRALEACSVPLTVVVGHQKEALTRVICEQLSTIPLFVEQDEQRGTGHAVMCSAPTWSAEHILILNGDCPFVTAELLLQLYKQHITHNATVSFVTSIPDPELSHEYGKVVHTDSAISIVEARDYQEHPITSCCINAGIYLIKKDFLEKACTQLTRHENSNQWYITDVIAQASQEKLNIYVHHAPFDTVRGINTLAELMAAEKLLRATIIQQHISQGVYFEHPDSTIIDSHVQIEPGASIGTGVLLTGRTIIGASARIHAYCVINSSHIKAHAQVGPFAHLRNQTMLESHATIGNFVETSASVIGAHSKAKHLSYLGNAAIGEHVNIGAGTITCNYDGVTKNTTTIENHAHIGSNNSLVAPVTIGHDAVTGAGSVITDDVPPYALAIARARQVTKEQYMQKVPDKPFIPKELK